MSHDVRKEFALRVLTEQARLQVRARKAIAVRGKPRDLGVRKTRADREAFEVSAFVEQFLEASPVLGSDFDQGRKLVDQRIEILHFTRRDLERVGRIIVREDDAVTVDDDAAIGHDGHDRDAVGLGQRVIMRVLTTCR